MLLNDDDEPPLKKYSLFCTAAYVTVMVFCIVQYSSINGIVAGNDDAKKSLVRYRENLFLINNITKVNSKESYCPNFYSNAIFCKNLTNVHDKDPNYCTPTWFYGSDIV